MFIVLLYFCCLLFWVFFTFAASFPSVLWYCWLGLLTCKTVSQITYTVLAETLNTAQSINQSVRRFGFVKTGTSCNVTEWSDTRGWCSLYRWENCLTRRGSNSLPRQPRTCSFCVWSWLTGTWSRASCACREWRTSSRCTATIDRCEPTSATACSRSTPCVFATTNRLPWSFSLCCGLQVHVKTITHVLQFNTLTPTVVVWVQL